MRFVASQKLSEAEALQKGMEAKAVEFVKQGVGFLPENLKEH